MLLRWGLRLAEAAEADGAVVALEVDGDGVDATDEEEVVVGAVAEEAADMIDGSWASIEDMVFAIVLVGVFYKKRKNIVLKMEDE